MNSISLNSLLICLIVLYMELHLFVPIIIPHAIEASSFSIFTVVLYSHLYIYVSVTQCLIDSTARVHNLEGVNQYCHSGFVVRKF